MLATKQMRNLCYCHWYFDHWLLGLADGRKMFAGRFWDSHSDSWWEPGLGAKSHLGHFIEMVYSRGYVGLAVESVIFRNNYEVTENNYGDFSLQLRSTRHRLVIQLRRQRRYLRKKSHNDLDTSLNPKCKKIFRFF